MSHEEQTLINEMRARIKRLESDAASDKVVIEALRKQCEDFKALSFERLQKLRSLGAVPITTNGGW